MKMVSLFQWDMMPKAGVNFDIDESLHTQLKILAAKERRTIAELLRKLIEKRVA